MSDLAILDMTAPVHSQLWESVVLGLRQAIVTGALAPGTHLVEADLAQRLNVSRGPIREALARLEQEGLVVNYPYRGKFVAEITAEDVREVYDLRILLETRAIKSLTTPLCSEELVPLKRISAEMSKALSGRHNETFADLDVEFHRQLVMLSKRERLLQLWNNLAGLTHAFIVLTARNDSEAIRHIDEGHDSIVDALVRHDVPMAIDVLTRHLYEAEDAMLRTRAMGQMAQDGKQLAEEGRRVTFEEACA